MYIVEPAFDLYLAMQRARAALGLPSFLTITHARMKARTQGGREGGQLQACFYYGGGHNKKEISWPPHGLAIHKAPLSLSQQKGRGGKAKPGVAGESSVSAQRPTLLAFLEGRKEGRKEGHLLGQCRLANASPGGHSLPLCPTHLLACRT